MSELENLTAAPRPDILPGRVLSPFGLADYALIESQFARDHIAEANGAGDGLPPAVAARLLELAMLDVRAGSFNWGRQGYDARCLAARSLPFLLWVCLRINDKLITQAEAEKLVTRENERELQRVILELAGFKFDQQTGAAGKKPDPQSTDAQPTGDQSSPSSEKSAA